MLNIDVRNSVAMLCAGAFAMTLAAPATAEIYKWTDAQGVVHYTNQQPPSGHSVQRVRQDQLSVVALPKPSAEEVRALNERLLHRRIDRLEDELRAQRSAPSIAYAPGASAEPIYYPGGGGYFGEVGPPLGEVIIDRDLDENGRSRHTNIRYIPRYEIRPGPYGVGAQAVPVSPPERRFPVRKLP